MRSSYTLWPLISVKRWLPSLKKGLGRVWKEWWMYMTNQFKMFKSIFNGPRLISEMRIQFLWLSFKSSRISMKWSRQRYSQRNSFLKKIFKKFLWSLQRSFLCILLLSTSLWLAWRIIKNVILLSISRKKTSSTLKSKDSSLSMKHRASIFIEKEDNYTILYIKFVNIRISKLIIFRFFM